MAAKTTRAGVELAIETAERTALEMLAKVPGLAAYEAAESYRQVAGWLRRVLADTAARDAAALKVVAAAEAFSAACGDEAFAPNLFDATDALHAAVDEWRARQ